MCARTNRAVARYRSPIAVSKELSHLVCDKKRKIIESSSSVQAWAGLIWEIEWIPRAQSHVGPNRERLDVNVMKCERLSKHTMPWNARRMADRFKQPIHCFDFIFIDFVIELHERNRSDSDFEFITRTNTDARARGLGVRLPCCSSLLSP